MNAETSTDLNSSPTLTTKNKRWSSWLLLAAIGLPMVMAYVVFSTGLGMPTGTVNKGDLLLPATPLTDINITLENGQPLALLEGKKKWRWLIVGDNSCAKACQENLYLSRQVHIRLGDKAVRLERLYLNTDTAYSPAFAQQLRQQHPRLVMAHVNADEWQQVLQQSNAADLALDGTHLYVVDQQGFAMMTYSTSHEGSDLLDDIKRLLKYSYED